MRTDRADDELRTVAIQRNFTGAAPGSVLISAGKTTVLCSASVAEGVPPWRQRDPELPAVGWLTAEYSMLPGSTVPRKPRDRSCDDAPTTEIQRLIGRSLRAVVDFEALGAHTVTVDCDVLEADGGTRTLSITGGFIAAVDAVSKSLPVGGVFVDAIAAVSVGVFNGRLLLDLDYVEDSGADVDMNVVMTGKGEFIEVQGTAERQTFDRQMLDRQLDLATQGIRDLMAAQRAALGAEWPLDS